MNQWIIEGKEMAGFPVYWDGAGWTLAKQNALKFSDANKACQLAASFAFDCRVVCAV